MDVFEGVELVYPKVAYNAPLRSARAVITFSQ